VKTPLRTAAALAALAFFAAPAFSQDDDRTMEVYVIGSYGRAAESSAGLYGAAPKASGGGGFFGAGFGGYSGLIGMQAEFQQWRTPTPGVARCLNTGVMNFLLEKRTGSVRPSFLLFGIGGTQGVSKNYLFLETGVGVTIRVTHGLFVRPQFRLQDWNDGPLGHSQMALGATVAVGYRFVAPDYL